MIISCPVCKKKFNIDDNLIPTEGRDLQCGSCNHVWFYNIENESSKPLSLNEDININEIELDIIKKEEDTIADNNQTINKTKKEKQLNEISNKNLEEQKKLPKNKKGANTSSKFFSYLIVFIISFVALIILLDTLKTPLINVFPGLEIILFNLFETLQDIKLFIIDLI